MAVTMDLEATVVRETDVADDRTDAASDNDSAREVVRGMEDPPRRFLMKGDMEDDPSSSSSGTLISDCQHEFGGRSIDIGTCRR